MIKDKIREILRYHYGEPGCEVLPDDLEGATEDIVKVIREEIEAIIDTAIGASK